MKSLELSTDRLATTGVSTFEHHADRIVQRTPGEPEFWFGNRVIFTRPPASAEAAITQFQADFPEARHLCMAWDEPNKPIEPLRKMFAGTGVRVDQGDVLTLTGPFHSAPMPRGIELRFFEPDDWAQSHDIAMDVARDDGLPLDRHRAYLEGREKTRRRQIEAGLSQWVGAFEGDLLVGDMGIVQNDRLIRYQVVQTRKSHRRRGIASALLGFALDWARGKAPEAIPVIVADADSNAGRLYRRAGFSLAETTAIAWRPGD